MTARIVLKRFVPNLFVITLAFLLLSSCATTPQVLSVTGADRAAGTVVLSTTAGTLQSLVVDFEQSGRIAAQSCKAWGYNGARALGGYQRACNETSFTGSGECIVYRYNYTYQCAGSPTATLNVTNTESPTQNKQNGAQLVEDLNQLQRLHDAGTLSDEEFNGAKRRLLGL